MPDREPVLLNRSRLFEALGAVLRRAERIRRPSALLMISVNALSAVNTRLGIDVGDELIAAAGRLLTTKLAGDDTIGRYGSNTFAVIVENCGVAALPGIAASLMASAILGWSDYLFALTFLRDPARWTVTVGIQSLFGEHVTHWNSIMAGSLLATVPMLLLFLALGRFLVSGLTAGAVKQ